MVIRRQKTRRFVNRKYVRQYRQPSVFGDRMRSVKNFSVPRWFYKLVFFLMILGAAIYFVFFSSTFAIKDVFVEGNHYASSEAIASHVSRGGNIFLFNSAMTKEKIMKDLPEISSLTIYRGIPNAVKIVVAERDARLIWQTGSDMYLVSSKGEIAKKIVQGDELIAAPKVVDKKNIPVEIGAKIVSPSFINFIITLYDQFPGEINIKPLEFSIDETTFDVNLSTEAGFYVKFNTLRSTQGQLNNLKRVLVEKREEVHEYIDLRIDGWAYYK